MSSDNKQNAPQGSKPIQYYGLATPNGKKVSIALEELGLEYDSHTVDIRKNTQFEDWFKAINPNSKIPAIVDRDGPDGKPINVFESGAILLYLAEKTGKLLPKDPRKRNDAIQWLFWQMAGLGPMFGQTGHFWVYAPEDVPYGKKRYLTEAKRLLQVLETQLEGKEFVIGDDYTIADIAIYPWVEYFLKGYGERTDYGGQLNRKDYPNVERWLKKIGDRPAVQKGMTVASM